MTRFPSLPLALLLLFAACLAPTPGHSQAVNQLAISNAPPSTNFVLVVMGNRLLRVPFTNVWDLIQPASAIDFHDLTATNHLGFGPSVFSWRNDGGLAYLWNDTEGSAPLAIDEATDLVSATDDLHAGGDISALGGLTIFGNTILGGTLTTTNTANLRANVTIGGTLHATGIVQMAESLIVDQEVESGSIINGSTLETLGLQFTDGMMVPASNLTNYTLVATTSERTLNMTNAVRFTLLSGSASGQKYFPAVSMTNYTSSPQTIAFTNTWLAVGSVPRTIRPGGFAKVVFEVEGVNVRYWVTSDEPGATQAAHATTLSIDATRDTFLDITNAVSAAVILTISNPTVGTSGSVTFRDNGTTRNVSLYSATSALVLMATNNTSGGTNVITTAGKYSLLNWTNRRGTNGTINTHWWAINAP